MSKSNNRVWEAFFHTCPSIEMYLGKDQLQTYHGKRTVVSFAQLDITIGVEEFTQVAVEKDSLRIKGGADTPEIVPMRVELGEAFGGLRVHLAPMRTSLVATENLFDMAKIFFVLHTAIYRYRDIG